MKKKLLSRLLSLALTLVLVAVLVPHLPLTAQAAPASDYLITAPTLNETSLYFNGESQSGFITPGVAKEGYEIRYKQSGMVVPPFPNADNISLSLPGSSTVYYVIYNEGAAYDATPVSDYAELGKVTMHRAIPEYVTRPAAIDADAASWDGVPLVTAGTTNLPEYFAVEYKKENGVWSKEIPEANIAGTYTVHYRLAAQKDRFAITQIQGMDADQLLDLSNPQEGSVQVTIGKPATISIPVTETSLIYSGQNQPLLKTPATSTAGAILYSVTDASATAPGTGTWSPGMPAATNAGDYKVWYKTSFTNFDDMLRYFAGGLGSVNVSIGKLTPSVTSWPSANIYVGDTLKDTDLTGGSASVEGSFSVGAEQSWNSAGMKSATVTFTPEDATNYSTVTNNVTITVRKRDPSHVVNPAPITMPYGTSQDALGLPSTVNLVTKDGKSYPVPVTWSGYDPEPGALGTQTLTGTLDLSGITAEVENPNVVILPSIQVTLVNRVPGQVNYADKSVPYTGSQISHELTALPEGVASVSYLYEGGHTVPGSYAVTASFTMEPFYAQLEDAKSQLTITNAELAHVSVAQAGTLIYNGQPQTPEVNASASSQGGQEVTFFYCTAQIGGYDDLPSFTDAGTYTVYYLTSTQHHYDTFGSFEVTVAKQEVTPPTIASKVYNGQKQTADVPPSDLYAVTLNNGGTEGGEYIVELKLNDPANYCWPAGAGEISGENGGFLTLKFTITHADNAWVTEPSIADWTYGVAPSAPAMGEPVYGKGTTSVSYVGTTNAGVAYESTEAPTAAGDYKAVFTVPATGSYSVLTKEVPFTVKRTALPDGISFNYTEPTDLTYNGQEQAVTVTLGAALSGVTAEHITLNYSDTPKNAGDYTFTISIAQSGNYEASTAPLTNDAWKFTINKAKPVITWDINESFTYNGKPQCEGRAKVTLMNEEVYGGTITYTHKQGEAEAAAGLPTDAGTYKVTAAIAEQGNYLAATAETTIVINPKAVTPTVVIEPEYFTCDGTAKEPAVKVMDDETEIPAKEYNVAYTGDTKQVGAATVTVSDKENGNYTVGTVSKVYLILPDASALDGVTTDNVNSSHQAAIDEIQAAMSGKKIDDASTVATGRWMSLVDRCARLEKVISDTAKAADDLEKSIDTLLQQPKTSDLKKITEVLNQHKALEDNLTDAEKKALEEKIGQLEDTKAAMTLTNTNLKEVTDGTASLDEDELVFADKAAIKDLLEKAENLESNPYLTDDQVIALADTKEQLKKLEDKFAAAEKVEKDHLNKLPAEADPDDADAIKAYEAAKKAYTDLGTAGKAKVDPKAVKKLEGLKAELTDYEIIKGSGAKWVKGSSKGMTFTANGYHPHFEGVEIDGKLIDDDYYTDKSGSTIVTLKASYLQKLKSGKHTITILFGDGDYTGEAEGTFKISYTADSPATGDSSNVILPVCLAIGSLLCLAVLVVNKKKFYQK